MTSPTAVAGPALLIEAEGEESPGSARCFAAVRDLARLAGVGGRGVVTPLVLRVRYAIDTPFALATDGAWRISSDWDATSVTFQAVLRPEHVDGDEDAQVRRLLQVALANARAHAERTGLARSLDGLDGLVEDLVGRLAGPGSEPENHVATAAAAPRPTGPGSPGVAGERRAWMSTTLPTTSDRVTGWQREFQAKRRPGDLQAPALAAAFDTVAPRLPLSSDAEQDYACLVANGASGVLAAVRVPARMLATMPLELDAVITRLGFARDIDPDVPDEETASEALLRPSARRAKEGEALGPMPLLVRFGAELGVHEDGSPSGRRVGVLVLLDDAGEVTRVAATSRQLRILGFDLRSCLGLLERWRLRHHPLGRDPNSP